MTLRRLCLQSRRKGAVSERMEAVAGRSCDEGPTSRSGSAAVLDRVAALAHRIIEVDEAIVLVRGRARGARLVEVARHRRPGALRRIGRPESEAVRRALENGVPVAESG